MSAHDEYMTRRQARDLARRLARLERKTRSTAAAHADLRHSSVDGGVFKIKDADGNTAYELGTDTTTGVTAPQYRGGPVPEQPQAPFVDVGGEVVKIQHSGLDVHEAPAPGDFRRAQIHVSQTETFEPSLSSLAGYLEEADGSFTHRLPGGEWYVGIVWETLSGKRSVMSDTVLADIPPLVDTSDLEDTLAAAEEKLNTYRDEVAAPRFQALEEGLETHEVNIADARTRLETAETELVEALEGPIDHERLRVGEGAFDEAFASKLIADHATIISAAIKNLSVTERADLFEAFITTLGAQEAVIDLLIGTEAWIGGTMLKDDTVTTQHIEFTETLVGNIAELLHLVVDRIDVNSLWADQTWQAAGHFGSEDADQQTRVDGTGVALYRKVDGEFIPAAVFGGGDLQLVFIDDQGNPTGTLTRDGHMSGVESNFQNYVWQGRQLFGRSLQEENIPVLDSLTHKFVARNRRVMDASDGANQEHYGFLPLTFHAVAGMTYEIIVPSIRMWNIGEAGIVFAQIHYTTDGRPPVLSDPILGGETTATTANVGTQKIIQHFSRFYDAEEDGEVNLLLAVRTEIGAEVARWLHSASSEASVAEMLVRPAGATTPITGGTRDVTLGNPDLGSGEQYYQTGWTPTWHQAYINTTRYTGTATHMLAGTNGPDIRYSTHFGGYRNSPGYGGSISDAGQTMQQALGGAFIANGTLTLTGAPNPTSAGGQVWVQWHTHTSAPTTFTSDYPARLIQSVEITAGQQSVIDLPRAVLDAIAAGTFQGFTIHHPTADVPYVSIRSAESTDLITNQPIMRLGYVR